MAKYFMDAGPVASMEREVLSDGSEVFNLRIGPNPSRPKIVLNCTSEVAANNVMCILNDGDLIVGTE